MFNENDSIMNGDEQEEFTVETNTYLPDEDFDGIVEDNTHGVNHDNIETSPKMEKIIKDFEVIDNSDSKSQKKGKYNFSSLPKAVLRYLNRNKIFLGIVFITWMLVGVDYSYEAYKIPVIGPIINLFNSPGLVSILRFFTATYNGPMSFGNFMKPTFNGYLAAFAAKPIYLLAMTGVVTPLVKSLIKKEDKAKERIKNNITTFKKTIIGMFSNIHRIALALAGCGMAIFMTNLLTRNGKIDKGFVPILIAFVLFMGLNAPLSSLLDMAVRKGLSLFVMIMPDGINYMHQKQKIMRIGAMIGFLIALITGYFGEFFNYYLGAILFIGSVVAAMIFKEKKVNGN